MAIGIFVSLCTCLYPAAIQVHCFGLRDGKCFDIVKCCLIPLDTTLFDHPVAVAASLGTIYPPIKPELGPEMVVKREGKLHWPGAAQYPTMINPRLLLIRLGSPVNVRESKTRHYFKTTGWFYFWLSVSVVDQGVASASAHDLLV